MRAGVEPALDSFGILPASVYVMLPISEGCQLSVLPIEHTARHAPIIGSARKARWMGVDSNYAYHLFRAVLALYLLYFHKYSISENDYLDYSIYPFRHHPLRFHKPPCIYSGIARTPNMYVTSDNTFLKCSSAFTYPLPIFRLQGPCRVNQYRPFGHPAQPRTGFRY